MDYISFYVMNTRAIADAIYIVSNVKAFILHYKAKRRLNIQRLGLYCSNKFRIWREYVAKPKSAEYS